MALINCRRRLAQVMENGPDFIMLLFVVIRGGIGHLGTRRALGLIYYLDNFYYPILPIVDANFID